MVHSFDYPAKFLDDPVKRVLSRFGEVKNVKRQKYIGRSDIETGTHLVLMAFRVVPPRLLNIDGYFCHLWYKGQPLICNLCNVQGHKSVDCPNWDNCRGCGESRHFALSCPSPWGTARAGNTAAAPVEEFPHLPSAAHPGVGGPSSCPATASGASIDSIINEACDSFLDDMSIFSGDSDNSGSDIVASVSVEDAPAHGGNPDVNSNVVSFEGSVSSDSVEDAPLHGGDPDVNSNVVSIEGSVPNTGDDVNGNTASSSLSGADAINISTTYASRGILQDVVINQCEERPPPVSSGSGSVSVSVSGSGALVHKRGLADPSSEGTARNKKVAKELSRKAGKSSSSKASSSCYPLGAAKHVGLPSSVSAVPPRSRIR